jgi:integrase
VKADHQPRGPYAFDEAQAIHEWVKQRAPVFGQALRFILSSGARIDEVFHLRSDKIYLSDKRVELIGKGGRVRKIRPLHLEALRELDLSQPFIYLRVDDARQWKYDLERRVRAGCDALGIQRRGVHGFRGTAACEFVRIKRALGFTEMEARKELAMWLGHDSHRTEVTYAYVPKHR